jgi:hypothetical protein
MLQPAAYRLSHHTSYTKKTKKNCIWHYIPQDRERHATVERGLDAMCDTLLGLRTSLLLLLLLRAAVIKFVRRRELERFRVCFVRLRQLVSKWHFSRCATATHTLTATNTLNARLMP